MSLSRYGTHLALDSPTFNAGVYGVNLARWRREEVHQEVLFWMQQVSSHLIIIIPLTLSPSQHVQKSLWKLGTQPLLLLVAHSRWAAVDSRWNVDGLGWRGDLSPQLLSQAFILHWSGKR